MVVRALAGATGLFFGLNGARWLIDAPGAAGGLGMPPLVGIGLSSQMGDIGGFFIALAAALLIGAYLQNSTWLRAGALMLGSAYGKRGLSTGISGALALGTYFMYALVPLVEGLEQVEKVFPFYYYIGADPLTNGLNLVHAAVLIVITAALLAVAIVTFERRDLAV